MLTHLIPAWYLQSLCRQWMPIYPLYAVMFGEYGVSPLGLSVLFALWSATSLLTEIPSGALADRTSRKTLIMLSSLGKALGFAIWWLWPSFWGFLLGFMVLGLSGSLYSGTAEALLYDALKQHKRTDEFARIYGRGSACKMIGVSLGMITGGWLISYYDYMVLLQVSIGMGTFAALVTWLGFYDPPRAETVYDSHYLATLRTGLHESIHNRRVLFVVLLTATLLMLPGVYDEFVGPVLAVGGFTPSMVAYCFAVIYLAQAAGMALAHRVQTLPLDNMFGVMLAAGVVLLSAHFGPLIWLASAAAIYFGLAATIDTLLQTRLQHSIQSGSRATVTSTAGASQDVSSIICFMAFGAIATEFGMVGGTLAVALSTVLLVFVFALLARAWRI